ncbi:MAG: hypothetical protein EXS41_07800 [Opitutaceae bacterium]|nr:hypothetical protein [Opitutaceae bacterium]
MNRSPLLLRLFVAAALFLTLSALCLRKYYPPLAYPLTVDLVLARGTAGQSEPLVVSGRKFFGDFLVVQYLDPTHVIFAYDSWGHPGWFPPTPITITPGTPLRLRIEMPALNQLRGHFSDPPGTGCAWRWALLCGLLSLHARPSTGLCALTFLGCVSVAHFSHHVRSRAVAALPRHLGIGALCVLGVLTFNGLSYLKFKTFDGAPLYYSRPYSPERLTHIEGKSFHAANIPYSFCSYFMRPHFRVEPRFP